MLLDLARPKTACAAAWPECANPCWGFLSCTTRGSIFDPSRHPIMQDSVGVLGAVVVSFLGYGIKLACWGNRPAGVLGVDPIRFGPRNTNTIR